MTPFEVESELRCEANRVFCTLSSQFPLSVAVGVDSEGALSVLMSLWRLAGHLAPLVSLQTRQDLERACNWAYTWRQVHRELWA